MYKTAISIKNGVMNGNARFVIKLEGFEGDKEDLKEVYEDHVLPEIIATPPPPEVTEPYPEGLS